MTRSAAVSAFVTHDPLRKSNQQTPVVSAQPYLAGDRAPHSTETLRFHEI